MSYLKQFVFGFLCASVMLWSFPSQAQSKHPLDQAFEKCVEQDGSTAGMHFCHAEFLKKWDQELNHVYKNLGGDKNPELRNSQVAWLKYRDLEFRRIEKKYQQIYQKSGGGTIWSVLAGSEKVEVVRHRALLLYHTHQLMSCGLACPD